ncbi:unnamed protein product [Phyllotreta striolata]|uniref:Uncharacterized protein n=1 Tax=Phyllotreta striolata TaxID=444603 RepID=A0A9N9TE57_PHYSR|nr:unnamed protein product [Phyllotreta striolata]
MARKRPLTRTPQKSVISAKTIKISPKGKPSENGLCGPSKSLMVISKTFVNTNESNNDLSSNSERKQNCNTSLTNNNNGSFLVLNSSVNDLNDDPLDYELEFVENGQNNNGIASLNNSNINESCSIRSANITSTLEDEEEENFSNVSHERHFFRYSSDVVDESPLNLPIHFPTSQSKVLLDSPRSSSSDCSNTYNYLVDEENDSFDDCSITAEEEERLLQSDNESSPILDVPCDDLEKPDNCENYNDAPPVSIFRNSKVTMKGNQIIIKAVTAFKPETPAGKSKCWDMRYHPYSDCDFEEFNPSFNSRSICLNDIGYDPLISDEEEKTSIIPPKSSSSTTNVKVTLDANQERKFCKTDFKIPKLPPIKRPPTRPKKTIFTKTEPDSPLSTFPNHISKDVDVISIAASSVMSDQMELDKQNSELNKSSEDLFNPDQLNSDPFYVENWLTQVNNAPPFFSTTISTPPSVIKVEGDEESTRLTPPRVDFKKIPRFFNGLCYYFFIREKCNFRSCIHSHTLQQAAFLLKCQSLNQVELEESYNFASRFPVLFRETHPIFINVFGMHKMQSKLIAIIGDIFALNNTVIINKAIELIVDALRQIGLTLLEAVEKISFNIGFLRYPTLADILIEILSKEPNLSETWEEIKRICKAKNFIAPHTLETILRRVIREPNDSNRNLCKDVYNTIIKNKMTDVSKIKTEYILSLKTLVEFGNKPANCLNTSIDANTAIDRDVFEASDHLANQIQTDSSSDIDDRYPTFRSRYSEMKSEDPSPTERSPCSSSSSSRSSSSSSSRSSSRSSSESFRHTANNRSDSNTRKHESLSLRSGSPYVPQTLNRPNRKSPSTTSLDTINSATTITSSASKSVVFHRTVLLPSVSSAPVPQITAATNSMKSILFPERPIFGKFNYKSDFVFEKSLHNLLPCPKEQVVLNEPDIIKLNDVIKNADGNEFLQLFEQYKGPNTLQQFITMSIAHLKNTHQTPSNSLMDLVENLEASNPQFKHDPILKGVLEVIVFNLLIFVERKCLWADGRKLIEMFCDWDSLISSKQFTTNQMTPIGRFIFLAKLLAEAKAFYKVYDILRSPDLRLLESSSYWPLFHCGKADLESRNLLLVYFFRNAYYINVEVVCDMYKNIFQFNDIWQFDSLCFFNPMLEDMIDKGNCSSLKHFLSDIEVFYKKMDRNIFRAFIILMHKFITNKNKINIYVMAVQKRLYPFYTGQETSIIVRTNMPDVELKFILLFYLHKYSCLPKPLHHDLRIEIKLPTEFMKTPRILRECARSIKEVNESIKKVFLDITDIRLDQSDSNTVVYISKQKLMNVNVLY